jgi:hypothetical protein
VWITGRPDDWDRCTLSVMNLASYEYRHPGDVVADVSARHPLVEGDALLALVDDPPGRQNVIHVTRVSGDEWSLLDQFERSQLLRDIVNTMPIPKWSRDAGPRHSIMTIVARRGLAVMGAAEAAWLMAWRYSHHGANAFSGGLILVTEHGWTDFMTRLGGPEPRLP